jgi:S1-C subfamily serine protease
MTRFQSGDKLHEKDESAQLSFYQVYSPCLVSIESVGPDGNISIGTAFHIGDGYLVTARHVVQGRNITSINPASKYARIDLDTLEIMYPEDEAIDLAVIRSNFSLDYYMNKVNYWGNPNLLKVDHIQIGGHMDDWINDGLVLFEVIVFGYPPIPTSSAAQLVAVRGEVNAIVYPYTGSPHPLFIVSPTPRGGFSGGPVLTKDGWLLGVMTSALVGNNSALETGFGAAITVEPLWNLLHENNVFPGTNAELWKEIWKAWPQ